MDKYFKAYMKNNRMIPLNTYTGIEVTAEENDYVYYQDESSDLFGTPVLFDTVYEIR